MYTALEDVGFGAMSCYGGQIETPNVDRIAANGLRHSGVGKDGGDAVTAEAMLAREQA
ncbi:hypothetical protein [Streptomyces sp. NPDC056527]|uniref:hypothetical protein n=1 Tax=Streptomyces sp. NPDC056527 TaxID=3345853 RepID=UPI0036942AAA